MSTSFETMAKQALQLSPEERGDLADRLWMSVHAQEEIDKAWEVEIQWRITQVDAGEVECLPWETVIEGLRDQLKRVG